MKDFDVAKIFRLEDRVLFEAAAVAEVTEAENQATEQMEALAEQAEAQQQENTTESEDQAQDASFENAGISENTEGSDATDDLSDSDNDNSLETVFLESPIAADDIHAEPINDMQSGEVVIDLLDTGNNLSTDKELAVITSDMYDKDTVIAELEKRQDIVVFEIDSGSDTNGLAQIQAYLDTNGSKYKAIHLITHGEAGCFDLGNERIDAAHFDKEAWDELGNSLTDDGEILIYGCDLASDESGEELCSMISEATGAEVAASTDTTGFGGDWELEYHSENFRTQAISIDGYQARLNEWTVTSNADDGGDGTLRYAIEESQAGDKIVFNLGTTQSDWTITLEDGIEIDHGLVIDGRSSYDFNLIITPEYGPGLNEDGSINDDCGITYDSVFTVNGSGTTTFSNLTIQGGMADEGGSISISSSSDVQTVILDNVTIERSNGGKGGAIYYNNMVSGSSLTIKDSLIQNNSNYERYYAPNTSGSVLYAKGDVIIQNSTFDKNGNEDYQGESSPIYMDGGTLTIENSIFSNNVNAAIDGNTGTLANTRAGGGVIRALGTNVVIKGAIFSRNEIHDSDPSDGSIEHAEYVHGGAIYAEGGTLTIDSSAFEFNSASGIISADGGALFLKNMTDSVVISNSTFYGNTAQTGAFAYAENSTVVLVNDTITGNIADSQIGGIALNKSHVYAVNTILNGNTGGKDIATLEGTGNSTLTAYYSYIENYGTGSNFVFERIEQADNILGTKASADMAFGPGWSYNTATHTVALLPDGTAKLNGALVKIADKKLYYSDDYAAFDSQETTGTWKEIAGLELNVSNINFETDQLGQTRRFTAEGADARVVSHGAYALEYNNENYPFDIPSNIVTTEEDIVDALDGKISLREALLYMAADSTLGQYVYFAPGITSITLNPDNGDLNLAQRFVINGSPDALFELDKNRLKTADAINKIDGVEYYRVPAGFENEWYTASNDQKVTDAALIALLNEAPIYESTSAGRDISRYKGHLYYNDFKGTDNGNLWYNASKEVVSSYLTIHDGNFNISGTTDKNIEVIFNNLILTGGSIHAQYADVVANNITVSASPSAPAITLEKAGTLKLLNSTITGNIGGIVLGKGTKAIIANSILSDNDSLSYFYSGDQWYKAGPEGAVEITDSGLISELENGTKRSSMTISLYKGAIFYLDETQNVWRNAVSGTQLNDTPDHSLYDTLNENKQTGCDIVLHKESSLFDLETTDGEGYYRKEFAQAFGTYQRNTDYYIRHEDGTYELFTNYTIDDEIDEGVYVKAPTWFSADGTEITDQTLKKNLESSYNLKEEVWFASKDNVVYYLDIVNNFWYEAQSGKYVPDSQEELITYLNENKDFGAVSNSNATVKAAYSLISEINNPEGSNSYRNVNILLGNTTSGRYYTVYTSRIADPSGMLATVENIFGENAIRDDGTRLANGDITQDQYAGTFASIMGDLATITENGEVYVNTDFDSSGEYVELTDTGKLYEGGWRNGGVRRFGFAITSDYIGGKDVVSLVFTDRAKYYAYNVDWRYTMTVSDYDEWRIALEVVNDGKVQNGTLVTQFVINVLDSFTLNDPSSMAANTITNQDAEVIIQGATDEDGNNLYTLTQADDAKYSIFYMNLAKTKLTIRNLNFEANGTQSADQMIQNGAFIYAKQSTVAGTVDITLKNVNINGFNTGLGAQVYQYKCDKTYYLTQSEFAMLTAEGAPLAAYKDVVGTAQTTYRTAGIAAKASDYDKYTSNTYNAATNDDVGYGGALYLNDVNLTISGGNISNSRSVYFGGAVYLAGNYNLTVTDGATFEANSTDRRGGAIYMAANTNSFTYLVKNATFKDNYIDGERFAYGNWQAYAYGGAGIYSVADGVKSELLVQNSVFDGNYIVKTGKSTYEGDTLTLRGAGIYQNGVNLKLTIQDSEFVYNWLDATAENTAAAGAKETSKNSVALQGAAIWSNALELTIENSKVDGNYAKGHTISSSVDANGFVIYHTNAIVDGKFQFIGDDGTNHNSLSGNWMDLTTGFITDVAGNRITDFTNDVAELKFDDIVTEVTEGEGEFAVTTYTTVRTSAKLLENGYYLTTVETIVETQTGEEGERTVTSDSFKSYYMKTEPSVAEEGHTVTRKVDLDKYAVNTDEFKEDVTYYTYDRYTRAYTRADITEFKPGVTYYVENSTYGKIVEVDTCIVEDAETRLVTTTVVTTVIGASATGYTRDIRTQIYQKPWRQEQILAFDDTQSANLTFEQANATNFDGQFKTEGTASVQYGLVMTNFTNGLNTEQTVKLSNLAINDNEFTFRGPGVISTTGAIFRDANLDWQNFHLKSFTLDHVTVNNNKMDFIVDKGLTSSQPFFLPHAEKVVINDITVNDNSWKIVQNYIQPNANSTNLQMFGNFFYTTTGMLQSASITDITMNGNTMDYSTDLTVGDKKYANDGTLHARGQLIYIVDAGNTLMDEPDEGYIFMDNIRIMDNNLSLNSTSSWSTVSGGFIYVATTTVQKVPVTLNNLILADNNITAIGATSVGSGTGDIGGYVFLRSYGADINLDGGAYVVNNSLLFRSGTSNTHIYGGIMMVDSGNGNISMNSVSSDNALTVCELNGKHYYMDGSKWYDSDGNITDKALLAELDAHKQSITSSNFLKNTFTLTATNNTTGLEITGGILRIGTGSGTVSMSDAVFDGNVFTTEKDIYGGNYSFSVYGAAFYVHQSTPYNNNTTSGSPEMNFSGITISNNTFDILSNSTVVFSGLMNIQAGSNNPLNLTFKDLNVLNNSVSAESVNASVESGGYSQESGGAFILTTLLRSGIMDFQGNNLIQGNSMYLSGKGCWTSGSIMVHATPNTGISRLGIMQISGNLKFKDDNLYYLARTEGNHNISGGIQLDMGSLYILKDANLIFDNYNVTCESATANGYGYHNDFSGGIITTYNSITTSHTANTLHSVIQVDGNFEIKNSSFSMKTTENSTGSLTMIGGLFWFNSTTNFYVSEETGSFILDNNTISAAAENGKSNAVISSAVFYLPTYYQVSCWNRYINAYGPVTPEIEFYNMQFTNNRVVTNSGLKNGNISGLFYTTGNTIFKNDIFDNNTISSSQNIDCGFIRWKNTFDGQYNGRSDSWFTNEYRTATLTIEDVKMTNNLFQTSRTTTTGDNYINGAVLSVEDSTLVSGTDHKTLGWFTNIRNLTFENNTAELNAALSSGTFTFSGFFRFSTQNYDITIEDSSFSNNAVIFNTPKGKAAINGNIFYVWATKGTITFDNDVFFNNITIGSDCIGITL